MQIDKKEKKVILDALALAFQTTSGRAERARYFDLYQKLNQG